MVAARRQRFRNSLVWAVVVFACAVVLAGGDKGVFVGVLVVLLCGAVASDQVLLRSGER